MTKSSIERVSDIKNPAKMPEDIFGKITLKNAFTGGQPRSSAASVSAPDVMRSFGSTFNMTYGRLKVICAISSVPKLSESPELMALPTNTNKSISDTPVTISGFIIGIFVTVIAVLLSSFERILYMPTAASVPSSVEHTAEQSDNISVFFKAVTVALLWNTDSYQRNENPEKTEVLLPALNEKNTIMSSGAYKNTKMSAVNIFDRTFKAPPPYREN